MERRYLSLAGASVRLDKRDDGSPVIVGYAAVFYDVGDPGTEYELCEGYYERVMPGCFDRAIREDDCRALYNHDSNYLLGRTASGTCRLSVDKKGLRYEIDPPDTQYAKDLLTCLKRGDISGSSFAFEVIDQTRREMKDPDKGSRLIREVNQVKLFDVSPVVYPAYESTESGLRSQIAADARGELEKWKAERAANDREIREAGARVMRMRSRLAEVE